MKYIGFLALLACFSCAAPQKDAKVAHNYKTPKMKLKSDVMTPEVLWSFGRIGGETVSPDGKTVLFGTSYFNKKEDKSYRDLYTVSVDGGHIKQITDTPEKEFEAVWLNDGRIAYLSAKSGSVQIWTMNAEGQKVKQITEIEGGIEGFKFSPDESKLVYTKGVKLEKTVHDNNPDLDKANARIINNEFYRHWDHWVEDYTHIFIADVKGSQIVKEGKDIMQGEKWESPVRPWGGMEQINWTADGKQVAYCSRKKEGVKYATSTNADIYLYNLETAATSNMTKGMMGYDFNMVFSPDGKYMAWESMEREGYEADKVRLTLMDLSTKKVKDISKNFDQNVSHLTWTPDSKSLYFISGFQATTEIYNINIENDSIRRITDGYHDFHSVALAGDKLIGSKVSISKPAEIYNIDPATGKDTEISFVNKDLLDQLKMGKVEKRWITTTDDKQMLVWVIYPPHFDQNKKYPALLYCQGGPQGTVSQFWSYRWNFQMMAANDYIVVAPNRRGLPSFGQEWNEQISGDYGGQNQKDYLSAIDNVKAEPYVDENRLGAVGASYGGFSVYWLAGHHEKRFKAFIAHDGMFNLEAQYLETEEVWFANWDLGGAFWEKDNAIAQKTFANSPHKFVDKWDTPILVIHGEKDYRIVASQGMSAFNAARLRGIPAQYLYFPEENHWVLGCQNGILWQRTFFGWLDKWLK